MLKHSPFAVATAGGPFANSAGFCKGSLRGQCGPFTERRFRHDRLDDRSGIQGIPDARRKRWTAIPFPTSNGLTGWAKPRSRSRRTDRLRRSSFNEAVLSQAIQNPVPPAQTCRRESRAGHCRIHGCRFSIPCRFRRSRLRRRTRVRSSGGAPPRINRSSRQHRNRSPTTTRISTVRRKPFDLPVR